MNIFDLANNLTFQIGIDNNFDADVKNSIIFLQKWYEHTSIIIVLNYIFNFYKKYIYKRRKRFSA